MAVRGATHRRGAERLAKSEFSYDQPRSGQRCHRIGCVSPRPSIAQNRVTLADLLDRENPRHRGSRSIRRVRMKVAGAIGPGRTVTPGEAAHSRIGGDLDQPQARGCRVHHVVVPTQYIGLDACIAVPRLYFDRKTRRLARRNWLRSTPSDFTARPPAGALNPAYSLYVGGRVPSCF